MPLTGLAGRRKLGYERPDEADSDTQLVLVLLDLDEFTALELLERFTELPFGEARPVL